MSEQTRQILDPVERTSEVLFGLIMVLTFTGSISVAESGRAEMRTVLVGAIGCNLAWGIVDAAMYLMANLTERARGLATLKAVHQATDSEAAYRLIRGALPPVVAAELTPTEVESVRQRLIQRAEPPAGVRLNARDFAGAAGVFLLVFLSTFPVVIPFILMRNVGPAMRVSNLVAALLLFAAGWRLGSYTGRAAWRTGLEIVAVAVVLVAITMALGG
jgi:VIT1/CCC1 family predicted Fe2+/Mn2+ transporter